MEFVLQPWQLLAILVNRQQQEAIDYLGTESDALNEKFAAVVRLYCRAA